MIGVNVLGVVNGIRTFVPMIRRHGEGGHVVNTASISGFFIRRGRNQGAYSMTKYAVVALSEALEQEVEDADIGVSVLCPGAVETHIMESAATRPERFGGPYERPQQAAMRGAMGLGLAPDVVGQRVLQAIRQREFYVLTHAHERAAIKARHDRIEAAFDRADSMGEDTMTELAPLDSAVLPAGVRSRFVPDINGLRVHILEAGSADRPCVLLLHGFPELAYSWRNVMPALADAGYHVVAPDLRGYGRTTGWHADYDSEADLRSFRLLNAVRDQLGLVRALGHRSVAAVVGHDFGSPVAAWCALVRPDVFRSVALMSAPFEGPPDLTPSARSNDVHAAMAALPRPRKHYQWYYSTRPANDDMWHCKQGVHCVPSRVLSSQERGLAAEQAVPSARLDRRRTGEDADLLHHGPRRDDGGDGRARNAVGDGDRRMPMAARQRACRVRRRV